MFEIILSTALTCQEGNTLMNRIKSNDSIDSILKRELIREIKQVMPKSCNRRG